MERIGPVAYRLNLPEQLSGVHNVFHVSNLKKCLADETRVVPLEELEIDEQLRFVEEPVEVTDQDIKTRRHSKTPIVRIRWNSKRGPEFTWSVRIKCKKSIRTYSNPMPNLRYDLNFRDNSFNKGMMWQILPYSFISLLS